MSKLIDEYEKLISNPNVTKEEIIKLVVKYSPKKYFDWPKLLRELADYMESQPTTIMLEPKQILYFIASSFEKEEILYEKRK